MLNTISAEEINKRAETPEKFISECEKEFDKKIEDIAKYVKAKNIRCVFISGPTSSGKTTFTKKLKKTAEDSLTISLDDYYKTIEDMPRKKDGDYNFESVNSIDLKALKEDLTALFEGKKVYLPYLDFSNYKRGRYKDSVSLKDNTLIIIEGLHALNPKVFNLVFEKSLKIFISPMTELTYKKKTASVYDIRFIRRIVRDNFYRNAKAEINIKMWPHVRAGEKIYMQGYKKNADFLADTFIPYELCVMKPFLEKLLSEVEQTGKIRRILSLISNFKELSTDLVPENSLLREFIK